MTDEIDDVQIEKVDGRTKAARAMRATRAATQEPTRQPTRQPTVHGGRISVVGRSGEVLSRTHNENMDVFYVPPEIIPPGYTYQWNTVSVLGSGDVALRYMNRMYANGWRAVPASRHPGRYTAQGHNGDIIVEGCRLEERPIELTDEAAVQDERKARGQMQTQNESVLGNVKKQMRGGFEMGGKYRGTGGDLRMSIDPALDADMPSYQPADDSVR